MPFESTTPEPTSRAASPDPDAESGHGAATVLNLDPHRRNVLRGAAAAGVAVCAFGLSACTSASSTPSTTSDNGSTGGGTTGNQTADSGTASTMGAPAQPGAGVKLGPASAIPVGGGKAFAEQKILVTQPTKGEFKAFTAVCTHQQCLINDISHGTMNCPCHGSKFSITDGSVKAGPAPTPVAAMKVVVTDGQIVVG